MTRVYEAITTHNRTILIASPQDLQIIIMHRVSFVLSIYALFYACTSKICYKCARLLWSILPINYNACFFGHHDGQLHRAHIIMYIVRLIILVSRCSIRQYLYTSSSYYTCYYYYYYI